MSVIDIHRIQETALWKQLSNGFSGQDAEVAKHLAAVMPSICNDAYQRMKGFASLHPQYTLHDETHLLRVTELMALILGEEMLHKLNPIEIALLILAAHFHDQGMVLDDNEANSLQKDPKYVLFSQGWALEHPTLVEVQAILLQNNRDAADLETFRQSERQLLAALHTDYIRITHGERSSKLILMTYGVDKRWEFSGVNLAAYVAQLSKSHVMPAQFLNSANGFNYDESIGTYSVNMVYLGVILRLADILDFDRDRTPDSLYRSIHFTSPVSLIEWEKHRSVTGWTINADMVRFTAKCEHPEYERAIRQFMDWIDIELSACYSLVKKFPKLIESYHLELPLITNRERIGPKDNAYIYHDLEFSLSRDQIVKLLMTDQLYGSANLCIRELLQNGLDALRLRRSIIRRDLESEWTSGKISFEHFIDENDYEIVRCTDNGVGMDVNIITKYLTNVGRSFYRSPEFEQERHSLQQANADFEPIGQFGIGFMSCFMLGDKIRIRTKKDYGQGGGFGPSLLVEINGLGGIVTIREVDENFAVGTSVEIQCSKFDGLLNYFNTKAQVVASIADIAIAPEFPITAVCTIPENQKNITIPNAIHHILTPQ